MPRNIFVLGLDDLNLRTLERLPDAEGYRFHQLLTIEELQQGDEIPLDDLLDKAERQLEAFDGQIDAVVGYWDFPISSMVPILSERFGLMSPPLEAVVKCEHKYWSRLVQQQVISEHPRFAVVDPFDPEAGTGIDVPYPYWLKPVKSFSSELAFRIEGPDDLERFLPEIREGIGRVGKPFDQVLSRLELPQEVAEAGSEACIAEEDVSGQQATVEGFRNGGTHVYAVVDSLMLPDSPSFERFQYPSRLPEAVQERMADVSRRLIEHIDLNPSTFNIEFFWNEDTDELHVLEVNPRHSQSHAKLFEYVHGLPNHKLMVDLPLGRKPTPPSGNGPFKMAAKWFLRRYEDGVVTRRPTLEEVAEVEGAVPGTAISVIVDEGDRLSELHDQDSFSFKLANVYVGANSEEELGEKYDRCAELLSFSFSERAEGAA